MCLTYWCSFAYYWVSRFVPEFETFVGSDTGTLLEKVRFIFAYGWAVSPTGWAETIHSLSSVFLWTLAGVQLALTQVSISCCCWVSWLIITRPISSYSVMNLRCRPPSLTCQRKFKANLCDLLLALKVINHRRDKLFFCSAWLKEERKLHSADANSCPQRAVHNKNRCTKVELMCEFCTDMGHQTPEVQG